ncbi:sensor histidine kinase [Streptomyces sp. NPDC058369]|uniref:sensor histidine kinase n=1 Tax=unclassified Streptomyces TaxID=2593676 RepID=UPI00225B1591|nr:HAMP domain-containing sensor histidine kinase [Streptomyces sp. NBC_01789]MCX4445071.1 HAMP domain-containing histidine kinase [Streptomyces sp. NBC_01789]
MNRSVPAEWAAVRRARLRIAVLTGVIITLLITVVGGVAHTVMVDAQNDQVWRELRYGAEYGDPARPPVCTWLYAPGVAPLSNAPGGFPLRADVNRVRATHEAVERTVRRDHTVYLVRTQLRADGDVVQAVLDMRFQLADRSHLWFALGVAEVVGLLAAAVTGVFLGRRAVAPLAEALTRQRRFVTDASHELRTPVTQVHTRAQVLARQAAAQDLPVPHRDGLARMVASTGRLGEVLDDLLLSASLAAGPTRGSERGPVDLVALARSVVAEERDRARSRCLTVVVDGPARPLFVDGIRTALRRAVGELLSNAIRHTPAGGRIELTVSRSGGLVVLAVSDTGPGFDPAAVEQLFQRFHRGSGDGGRYGLGLALLREVVERHGGTVTASGRPGHGARFVIRLPEYTPPPGAPAPARPFTAPRARRAGVPRRGRPRPADGPVRPGGSPR